MGGNKKDWWVDLGQLPDAHLDTFSLLPLSKTRGENKMKKTVVGQDKDSSIRKAKAVCASNAKRGIYS